MEMSKTKSNSTKCVFISSVALLLPASCANYALRTAASDGEDEYGTEASNTLRKNFYVNNLLKSTQDATSTIKLINNIRSMCLDGRFKLTKFVSNSREVIESIPESERSKELQSCLEVLPNDQTLGAQWNISEDTLGLRTKTLNAPTTKRGLLSTVHQVYDPLGMVSPFLLESQRILQYLCSQNVGWDEKLPEELQRWCQEAIHKLTMIQDITMPRCFHPVGFDVIKATLHHFADASDIGHGYCSYLQLEDSNGNIHCAFLSGRCRVNLIKSTISIPRLELMAAALAAKVGSQLRKEINIPIQNKVYWSDSKVVLGYLNNNSRRFKLFVSNRVAHIKERTKSEQWRYVKTDENPADVASRGLRKPLYDSTTKQPFIVGEV